MRLRSAVLTASLLFATGAPSVHTTAGQGTSSPPLGTGLILGRVVDAQSGQALSSVVVTLAGGSVLAAGSAAPSPPRRVLTNAQGRFVFRQLGRGSYTLTATVGGTGFSPNGVIVNFSGFPIGAYVNGGYGQRRPEGLLQSIDLGEGERIGDATIRLWHTAAITGTVLDEAGEPLVGVAVGVARCTSEGRLLGGPTTTTDDRGRYHLGSLPPGDFVVVVPQTLTAVPMAVIDALQNAPVAARDQLMFRFGATTAPPPNSTGIKVGGMSVPTTAQSLTNALIGPARADGVLTYQTTYHPSTVTLGQAQRIRLQAAEERMGVDVQLRPVRAVRVAGVLTDATGPVSNFGVHLMPADTGDGADVLEVAATMSDGAGAFTFPMVPSGQYRLIAMRIAPPPSATAPPDPGVTTSAVQPLAVGDDNIDGVVLAMKPGVRLSGRLVFDGAAPPPESDRIGRLSVWFDPTRRIFRDSTSSVRTQIAANGSFGSVAAPLGRYVVRAPDVASPWSMASVSVGGRDVTDVPFAIEGAELPEVVITYTDRPASVTGTVRTAAGAADAGASVFMFPADRRRWADARVSTRTFRAVRVSKSGAFTIPNAIVGDYLIAATTDDAAGAWPDESFLTKLASNAITLRVIAGQPQTVALRTGDVR